MSIGKRLRQLRVARGLTQTDLAEPYYTYSFVSAIEQGRRRPSQEALEHFAERLGVQPDELLTGRPAGIASEVELGLVEARRMASAGKLKQATERFAELRRIAKRHRLDLSEARALHGLALCEERRGRAAEAVELYGEVQARLGAQPTAWAADSIAGEARCHQLLGDVRFGIHIVESALERMKREGLEDPTAAMRLQASLVGLFFEAGLYERSYIAAEEALSFAPKVDDPERLAAMYINAAWALNHKGRDREAHETLVRAEHFFEQVDLKLELAQCRLSRGMMLARSNKTSQARREVAKAIDGFREVQSEVNEARALNEMARLERLGGATESATEHLADSIAILRKLDHPALLAWSYREMALNVRRDDAKVALKHLESAIELYERADESVELAITYGHLGDLLGDMKRVGDACDAYREGIRSLERNV